ncbi:hypothetical protein HHX47_DHR2000747 [Lentinula edodes]|nr:hypothetical protein HHX47_DHR2000747 [Lentinula edodes]
MPRTMKAEIQHNIVTAAHNFLEASILLEDLCDDDIPLDDLDNDCMEDAELLELAGVMTLQLAMEMDGDGTWGAYNQFPKSKDWFPASLQQPDRWFRSNYRITRALRELHARHLGWLGESEKKTVLNCIEAHYGFENCCGSGDGCQIRMGVAPLENPDEFLSRKKEHSVSAGLLE